MPEDERMIYLFDKALSARQYSKDGGHAATWALNKHCSQAPPGATGSSVSQVTASGGDKPEKDDDGNHKAENKRFRSVQRAVGAGQAVLGLNKNNAAGSNSMRVLDQLDGVIDKELRMLESNDGEAAPPSQADSMDASEVMQRFKSGQ